MQQSPPERRETNAAISPQAEGDQCSNPLPSGGRPMQQSPRKRRETNAHCASTPLLTKEGPGEVSLSACGEGRGGVDPKAVREELERIPLALASSCWDAG